MKYLLILVMLAGCAKPEKYKECPSNIKYGDKITPREGFYQGVEFIAEGVNETSVRVHIKGEDKSYWFFCEDMERIK
jgi:hypothetical protein